ncbi:MAG: hypothetical protein COA58_12970 [Bacteroidetes bacterium]|nr:MAG: hypothetical protein COA58_12970 [Bacteroidota bacterium]
MRDVEEDEVTQTMKTKHIYTMKSTDRVKLSCRNTLEHYFILAPFLIVGSLTLLTYFKPWMNGRMTITRCLEQPYYFEMFLIICTILVTLFQYKRLQFTVIHGDYSLTEFNDAIHRTSGQLDWSLERKYDGWAHAMGKDSFINLILRDGHVYINSNIRFVGRPNYFNLGEHAKNITIFAKHLNDVKKGLPEPIATITSVNVWSLKRTIIRVIVYSIFLGLLYIQSIAPSELKSLIWIPIALFGIYITLDIVNLFRNTTQQDSETKDLTKN